MNTRLILNQPNFWFNCLSVVLSSTIYTSVECRLPSHGRCRLLYSELASVNVCGGTHVKCKDMFAFTRKRDDVVWTCTGHTTAMSSPTLNEACAHHLVSLCSLIVIVNKQSALCSKQMVCNACNMCSTWNEWCAMLVLCDILDMNGVQCLYYVWLC